jgi:hypothetical protein
MDDKIERISKTLEITCEAFPIPNHNPYGEYYIKYRYNI